MLTSELCVCLYVCVCPCVYAGVSYKCIISTFICVFISEDDEVVGMDLLDEVGVNLQVSRNLLLFVLRTLLGTFFLFVPL